MKRAIKIVCFAGSIVAGVLFIAESEIFVQGVKKGLAVCADSVIPSLFLFMILSQFICSSGISQIFAKLLKPVIKYVFNLPAQAGAAVLMSFIGGYPSASKSIASGVRSGKLSAKAAQRMLCYCVNAGPSFIIGAVGIGMYGSLKTGVMLYVSQIISALLIGFALSFTEKRNFAQMPPIPENTPYSTAFVRSTATAVEAMLKMCGFIVFFGAVNEYVLQSGVLDFAAGVIEKIIPTADIRDIKGLFCGILEVTAGCSISASSLTAAFLLSFSGVSVIFQISEQFSDIGVRVSMKPFFISRIFHGLLTAFVFFIFTKIFPEIVSAGNFGAGSYPVKLNSESVYVSIALLITASVFLLSLSENKNKKYNVI